MYIMLMYLNEMDRYSVIVIVGIGICLIMGGRNGWVSLLMIVIIWPMFHGYIEWISMWISGVKLRETYKKLMVIVLMISLILITVGVLYFVLLSVGVYGMSSVIALGVYLWVMLRCGMVILMGSYLIGNMLIELNWKILVVGVLPLPVFFIKLIGRWMILYVVMYYGILVVCNI